MGRIGDKLELLFGPSNMSVPLPPSVMLPSRFIGGVLLSQFAKDIIDNCPNGWPPELHLDFGRLSFIEPSAVVFLSNLIWYIHEQKTLVRLTNIQRNVGALRYLDDSLFFEQHCGTKIWAGSSPRNTTQPLRRIAHSSSHEWLALTFLPWLAGRLGITLASLHSLKACLSELFNNIKDHTRFDIGSIFVQHYPRKDIVSISIADFGLGIPAKVRETIPNLSDPEAVLMAVKDGFTSRSTPGNKGIGLDYLLNTVVGTNLGEVTIYSSHAIVTFKLDNAGKICPIVMQNTGFCPGTTIDINLRTDRIVQLPDEREDLEW